jgi:pantoate--beta-alanine ligase
MKIIHTNKALSAAVQEYRSAGKTIGFVPTMGALHDGHLSLVKRAMAENDVCVCSIFVNPTQFNKSTDLENYPRHEKEDLALLEQLGCHCVFLPNVEEMYPLGAASESFDFGELTAVMEGKERPGHFEGVATIVKRLFLAVDPHKAYFGEKDFQQLAIIKALVQQENLPVKIVGCPIIREASGLAMSSRNERLSEKALKEATLIYEQLKWMKAYYQELSVSELIQAVEMAFDEHDVFTLEYVTVADSKTLRPFEDRRSSAEPRAFIAVWVEGVRLIDNMAL